MAKAKKLPSGQWRTLVYAYTDSDGKRHYESFTAETKKESEYMAAEFAMNKKKRSKPANYTIREAIDQYINNSDAVLSPTTLQGYEKIKRNSFQDIMDIKLKDITQEMLQSSVNQEAKRKSKRNKLETKTISPKTVANSYGLVIAVINRYHPSFECSIKLPAKENHIKELPTPDEIMRIVKGTEIELPVLLAMWLSFSMSEIRGIKRSSIKDGYISINEVVVDVNCEAIRKKQAKAFTRIRKHEIPNYIQELISNINPNNDTLITLSGHAIYMRFKRLLEKNGLPHMTFHDLRHMNASVMAMLRIPDKYAMERGGWKTDKVMKKVYTHTFSEEREKVDKEIDNYFEETLGLKKSEMDREKYNAWITLFEKADNLESQKEFNEFMQHKMQHIKKEP